MPNTAPQHPTEPGEADARAIEPTQPGRARRKPADTGGGEDPAPESTVCDQCGKESATDFRYCPWCGASLGTRPFDAGNWRDPLIGAVVANRYRLMARLGRGGMGIVYKVEHVHMKKVMAMKLLHGDLSRDETMVRRFSREARAVSQLRGPHTAQIFDFGNADGLFYIVMEYLRGKDLGELLAGGKSLSPRRAARIIRQIAEGLDEAHEQGIVHRDLKPENVFVVAGTEAQDETIKVLDFGLAKLQAREDSLINTQRGVLLGTPHYMSPEQIDGDDVGPSSDIYSLGGVAWKIVTGEPPFPGDNVLRVLNAQAHQPIPRLEERDPELSFLDAFFQSALAKAPEDRFPTVLGLADAFEEAVRAHEGDSELRSDGAAEGPEGEAAESVESDRLLPRLTRADAIESLATGADFDRFERRLRVRRVAVVLGSFLAVAALIGVVVWGVVLENFYDRSSEVEPNDSLRQANELHPSEPVLGSIGEPPENVRADRDVYRIHDVDPGRMVTVQVSSIPELDLVVEAVNAEGHLIVSQNARGEGYGEVLPNVPIGHDEMYVVVREVWREGEDPTPRPELLYAIVLDSRPPLSGEEHEPNDLIDDATPLASERFARGIVASENDVDLYRLPTHRGTGRQRLRAHVTGLPHTDVELALLDATGRPLSIVDDAGIERPETMELTVDVNQVVQPMLLRVRSVRGHSTSTHYAVEIDVRQAE